MKPLPFFFCEEEEEEEEEGGGWAFVRGIIIIVIMFHAFFPQQQQQQPQPPPPLSSPSLAPCHALLSGPPNSGKTSLLLQFAYNCALDESSTVVFICKRHSLERKPPLLPQEVDASSEVFERIHMKYMDDDEGIRKFFAAFHMQRKFPRAVIIDDLCEFFNEWKCRELYGQSRGKEVALIRTLAACKDAIDHVTQKLPLNICCNLLISDTHIGEGPRLLYIYQRWLSTIFVIQALDSSTFVLRIRQTADIQMDSAYAQYSTAEQYLRLEELKL